MTSRTTDLIAIGLIVVATLTLGRQVRDWWRAPPPAVGGTDATVGLRPGWEASRQPVALEFGELPLAMTRQVIDGNQKQAIDALVEHCRQMASAAHSPLDVAEDAEKRLLEMTAGVNPVAEEPGVWQVFVLDERFPMVAGLRCFAGREDEAAAGPFRLVCWGMALPAGQHIWNAYVFQGAQTTDTPATAIPEIPLPPGSRRNLSIRDEQGGALIGFSGNASPQEWMKYYDRWFSEKEWSSGEGWQTGSGSWSARFQKRAFETATTVEVHFAQDARGELTGLVQASGRRTSE